MVPEWSKGRCAWLKRALGLTVSTHDTSESMVKHELITMFNHLLQEERRWTCSGLKKGLIGKRLTLESDCVEA